MKLFSSKQPPLKEKIVAVFDISSGSVGGALVRFDTVRMQRPEVLASHRVFIQYQHEINVERLVSEVLQAIEKVLVAITKINSRHPAYVQIVLASPWFASQTRQITYTKTEPFVFTEKLLHSLIDREITYLLERDMEAFGSFGTGSKIVERQISLVKLNGYVTHHPFGKHASAAELYVTVTLTPEAVLSRIKQAIIARYHDTPVGFTTTAYTAFVAARDHEIAASQLTIVDVGEEATDVAFVKDGLFLYQHSFPVGTNALCRLLIDQKSCSLVEAESLLAAFRNNHLATSAQAHVADAVRAFRNAWQQGLQHVVQTGHFGISLPEVVLITADPRYEILLAEAVKTDPAIAHKIPTTKAQIRFLTPETFHYPFEGVVVDAPLCVAALFAERQLASIVK